jgi:ribosomal protein S18 acetylase RimI-like enzyme
VPYSTAPGARRWNVADALSRAREVVRTEGPRALVFRALAETLYRRLILFEQELDGIVSANVGQGLSFSWLDESALPAYAKLRPGSAEGAADRLRAGHRCFGTWLEGELVGARWVATESPRIEYLDLVLPLEDGEVYHYDSFTSPSRRRRGVSVASQAELATTLAAEGRTCIVRAVLPENRAAVRDAEKAGYRRRGRIGYVRVGRWRRELLFGPRRVTPNRVR